MVSIVLSWFSSVFNSCSNWFFSIINSTGTASLILSGFSVLFTVVFLIKPLRGGRGSDKAKKNTSNE